MWLKALMLCVPKRLEGLKMINDKAFDGKQNISHMSYGKETITITVISVLK